ncbi:MAG TPA: hypothetical protein VK558_06570 [Patescibacteria group bacterium]|nr:hypothetical protein [Patescibacteria group bacterium]
MMQDAFDLRFPGKTTQPANTSGILSHSAIGENAEIAEIAPEPASRAARALAA